MSTEGQAERWRAIASVMVILALSVGGIRQGIAYFNKPTLGSSCFASTGCRSGRCAPTLNQLSGICTHECNVDADCFGNFRCDARFGLCLWMPTQRFGDACDHTSQCLQGQCATFHSPSTPEFRSSASGWVARICTQSCDVDQRCPEDAQCNSQGLCVSNERVLAMWRKQQANYDKAMRGWDEAVKDLHDNDAASPTGAAPPNTDNKLVRDLLLGSALSCSFALLMGLFLYLMMGSARRDFRRLRAGKDEDGFDRTLLEGVAHAEQPLIAPMSQRRCIAWEWRLYEGPSVAAVLRKAAPFAVQTSQGPVDVALDRFAFPDLVPESSKQCVTALGVLDNAPAIDPQLIAALEQPEHAAIADAYALRRDRVHAGYPLIFREYRLDQDASCTVVQLTDQALADVSSTQTWVARGVASRARAEQRRNVGQQLRAWYWMLGAIAIAGPVIVLGAYLLPWLAHKL